MPGPTSLPGRSDATYPMDADGHDSSTEGGWTQCWAEIQDGVSCSIATTDPLGLCALHRARLGLGPPPQEQARIPVHQQQAKAQT